MLTIILSLGVTFQNKPYYELELPPNSIVYCDPPYEGNWQNLLYQQMVGVEETRRAWKNFLNFPPKMFDRGTIVALAGN